MPAHNCSLTRHPWEKAVEGLVEAGYPENEVEAFVQGYERARGQHPERYNAGWRALDRQRTTNNNRADTSGS